MEPIRIPCSPFTVARCDFAGSHDCLEIDDFPPMPASASLGMEIMQDSAESDRIRCAFSLVCNDKDVLSRYDRLEMEFRKKDVRRFIDEAAHDIPRLICSNLEGPEKEIFIYEVFDTHGNGSVWIDKENGIELGVSLDKTLFDESATWDMDDIDFSFSISSRTLDRFLNELEGCL